MTRAAGLRSYQEGRYGEAEKLLAEALREAEDGGSKGLIATSLAELARTYKAEAKLQPALDTARRSLDLSIQAYEPDSVEVAIGCNDVATVLQALGRYGEADPLYRRAVAILDKKKDPRPPSASNNLATLENTLGRYREAEEYYRRGLAAAERLYGSEHRITGLILNNLAMVYSRAQPLYSRALEIARKNFGENSLAVARAKTGIAVMLARQRKYAEAEPLLREALAVQKCAPGAESGLAHTLSTLAALLYEQGRYADAAASYEQEIPLLEKQLGTDNGLLPADLDAYVMTLRKTKRYAEAERLEVRATGIRFKNTLRSE